MTTAYARLQQRFSKIAIVKEAISVLDSDKGTVMPSGGTEARGDQVALLSVMAHELLLASETADDFDAADRETGGLDAWRHQNLKLMKKAYLCATSMPAELIADLSRAQTKCEMVWREARRQSNFSLVKSDLAEVVELTRQKAEHLGKALGLLPYDALMNEFQIGITSADVTPVFESHLAFLREHLPAMEKRQEALPKSVAAPPISAGKQEALCREISEQIGLNYDHAHLSISTHPGCGGTPTDVRLTTRYDEADYMGSLMGVVHETGHGLYEQGLPKNHARQPVGAPGGMAVHESQSLIIEIQACRSDAFLSWLGPKLHADFGGSPYPYTPQNLALSLRKVERSHIRVDADEVTYPAHIIHRFQIEQDLLSGTLSVEDLPEAWNSGINAILGITPPDDARGCLQDIHWYCGFFGYFPSYTLGAMASAQLMAAARSESPDIDQALARGDFKPLVNWLRKAIHSKGSLLGFNDLLKAATGKALDLNSYQEHLKALYL